MKKEWGCSSFLFFVEIGLNQWMIQSLIKLNELFNISSTMPKLHRDHWVEPLRSDGERLLACDAFVNSAGAWMENVNQLLGAPKLPLKNEVHAKVTPGWSRLFGILARDLGFCGKTSWFFCHIWDHIWHDDFCERGGWSDIAEWIVLRLDSCFRLCWCRLMQYWFSRSCHFSDEAKKPRIFHDVKAQAVSHKSWSLQPCTLATKSCRLVGTLARWHREWFRRQLRSWCGGTRWWWIGTRRGWKDWKVLQTGALDNLYIYTDDCLMLLSAYPSVSILQVDFFFAPRDISVRQFCGTWGDEGISHWPGRHCRGWHCHFTSIADPDFVYPEKICTHPSLVHKIANRSDEEAIYYHICTAQPPLATCLGLSEVCPQISQFCIRLPPNFTILSHFCQQQKYLAFQFSWILDRYLMVSSRVPQHPCPPLGELLELVVAATGWTASAPRWEWPGPDALGAPASTYRRSAGANWQAPRDPRAVGVGCKETWDFTRKKGELTCLGTT